MKIDRSVLVSAALGFLLGAGFAVAFLAVAEPARPRLDVRELRIVDEDCQPAAIIAVERGGAVLRFLDRSTGNVAAELGARDGGSSLLFYGPNSNPVAAITSLRPDGAATLYLGDAHVSPRVVLGAMPEQRLPNGEVDAWSLQFRNPHNTTRSLFRVLVQADQTTGDPYASLTLNGAGTTTLPVQK